MFSGRGVFFAQVEFLRANTFEHDCKTPLMCHRKFPPSFWNAAYQAPCSITNSHSHSNNSSSSNNNFFGADAYFQSSLYNFHKTWPYHYGSQSHTYPHTQ
ncbi:protein vestigial, partial [Plakobranchus ocellatus]